MVLRIGLALLVALVAGEVFLQAASFVASRTGARGSARPAAPGAVTILCVGDSHTYGLPLPPEESYPAQLEARLSERHPGRVFQVVNLGIPGMNSGYLANRLERQILQLRPRLVLVWVGINNQWNVAESEDARGALRGLLSHSRLYRLASIAWYTGTGYQYDPEQHGGWFEGEQPPSARRSPDEAQTRALAPGLARDLARIVETTRLFDTPVILLTYPMRKQRPLNRVIEVAGFEAGVPVLDAVLDFERAVADGHAIRSLIDLSAGPHPTAHLYGYIVESLIPVIDATLGLEDRASAGAGAH
ncbi:MAG: GDSL-type esterase/lipase family protein [Myxococcota bacterium]|nr:GDSL-type esterase/lipase family protein [Myxococcota bacterium]